MSNAPSRLRAYLDEMDRINAGSSITYGDTVHGMNDIPLNRSDIHAILEQLAAAQAVIAEVRAIAARSGSDLNAWNKALDVIDLSPADALQAHDRQVAAKAWDEGYTRGFYDRELMHGEVRDASEGPSENPYAAIVSEPSTPREKVTDSDTPAHSMTPAPSAPEQEGNN